MHALSNFHILSVKQLVCQIRNLTFAIPEISKKCGLACKNCHKIVIMNVMNVKKKIMMFLSSLLRSSSPGLVKKYKFQKLMMSLSWLVLV